MANESLEELGGRLETLFKENGLKESIGREAMVEAVVESLKKDSPTTNGAPSTEAQIREQAARTVNNYAIYANNNNLPNKITEERNSSKGEAAVRVVAVSVLAAPITLGVAAAAGAARVAGEILEAVGLVDEGATQQTLSDIGGDILESVSGRQIVELNDEKREEFKTRKAKQSRLSEQAALMLTWENLINKISKGASQESSEVTQYNRLYRNFTTIRYKDPSVTPTGHVFITNGLTKTDNMQQFFSRLPPQALSLLVPSIKLYKTFYPVNFSNVPRNSNVKGYDWRIPFDDIPVKFGNQTSEFVVEDINKVLGGNGYFHGVAIKSFSYEYKGTQPAEVNSNIEATLELVFQNPEELTKQINISFSDVRFVTKPKAGGQYQDISFSYSDLLNQSNKVYNDAFNPEYYRLKVECGYAETTAGVLDNILLNSGFDAVFINQIKRAVQETKVTLNLSPYNYDIIFNDNGTVNLKINFIASIDSNMITADADLFNISPRSKDLNDLVKKYSEFVDLKSGTAKTGEQGDQVCKSPEEVKKNIEDFKKKYPDITFSEDELERAVTRAKVTLYNSLFDYLIGFSLLPDLPQQKSIYPKVYYALFKPEILGISSSDEDQATADRIIALNDSTQLVDVVPIFEDKDASVLINLAKMEGRDPAVGKQLAENAIKIADERITAAYGREKEIYKIKFLLLGDILDVALEALGGIRPSSEIPRVVLGNIPIAIPTKLIDRVGKQSFATELKEIYPNLADIPISFELFQEFMIEHVVKPKKERYPIIQFIKDIISDLLIPSISPQVFGQTSAINASIRFSTSYFNFETINGEDVISGKSASEYNYRRIINDDVVAGLKDYKKRIRRMKNPDSESSGSPEITNSVNYMFVTCTSRFPNKKFITGVEETDIKNGIFHIRMGTDAGIVKKINFQKDNTPYIREMMARREGNSRGTSIRQVFNATVEMYGNNIFRPGDFVFLHPMYFYGTNKQIIDLEQKLGVGGYYLVTNVKTDINESDYRTIIKCVFQAHLERKDKSINVVPINSTCAGPK